MRFLDFIYGLEELNDFIGVVQVPIYARAQDLGHLLELKHAGTTDAILENAEVQLGIYMRTQEC